MVLLDFLPVLAGAFALVQFAPQLRSLARTGSTEGVSPTWAALTSLHNAGWMSFFIASQYWPALIPSTAVTVSSGVLAWKLRRKFSFQSKLAVATWAVLLVALALIEGPRTVGAVLAWAFAVQVAPSVLAAYRSHTALGIAAGTWWLILGELGVWLAYGLFKQDPTLIVLGSLGVASSCLVLARLRATAASRHNARSELLIEPSAATL